MKLTPPSGSPAWLPPVLRRIEQSQSEVWASPIKLQRLATADLPDPAEWKGGLVYDLTSGGAKYSNGAAWSAFSGGGGGVSDGDKGDITVTASGATWTIDNGVVSLAKLANMATGSLFYRKTAGTGVPEVQTLATLKTDLGLTGTNTGDQTTITGNAGTATALQTSRNFSIAGGGITSAAVGFDGSAAVVLVASVDAGHITLARMANLAANSFIGNNTGAGATPLALSVAQAQTLLNVANGATANSSDATLLARANHTGTQDGSTVTGAYSASGMTLATSRFLGRVTAATGAAEELTGTQATALLDAFTSGVKGLAPASGGGTSNFLRADGSWAAPSGGGGSGSTVVDFGAFPGASDASATVTGQAGILSGSRVRAWIEATATADHSADEHWIETIDVTAGNIAPGVGFAIYAKNTGALSEPLGEQWAGTRLAGPGTGKNQPRPDIGGGKGTRIYGKFTVGWEWN